MPNTALKSIFDFSMVKYLHSHAIQGYQGSDGYPPGGGGIYRGGC